MESVELTREYGVLEDARPASPRAELFIMPCPSLWSVTDMELRNPAPPAFVSPSFRKESAAAPSVGAAAADTAASSGSESLAERSAGQPDVDEDEW
jgi:hypothetical protein